MTHRAPFVLAPLLILFFAACGPAESSDGSQGQAGQSQGAAGTSGAGSTSGVGGSTSAQPQTCATLVNIKKYIADGLEVACLPCLLTVPSCCEALSACDADASCPTCLADVVAASDLCVDSSTFMTTPPFSTVTGCDKEGACLSKCSATGHGCTPSDPGYPNCK